MKPSGSWLHSENLIKSIEERHCLENVGHLEDLQSRTTEDLENDCLSEMNKPFLKVSYVYMLIIQNVHGKCKCTIGILSYKFIYIYK